MGDSTLAQFVENVSGKSHLRIEADYGGGFVRLRTSEAERRQAAQDIRQSEHIVLELLRNSRDAHASRIYVAFSKEGTKRFVTVVDDGIGIPAHMHSLVFEPRVTSKLDTSHTDAWGLHGRGMALFSIAENSELARVASSDVNLGCAMEVRTDVQKLPEKADQSSFPTFELGDDGVVNVRGPKNILRTICEFAIDSRQHCEVFAGSPAEICSALYSYGMATLSVVDRLFCDDVHTISLVKRLAASSDPAHFADIAQEMGLALSERTARRIIDGQLPEAVNVLDRVRIESGKPQKTRKTPPAREPSIKVSPEDRDALLSGVMDSYAQLASKYYLDANVKPAAIVKPDTLLISIPIVKE